MLRTLRGAGLTAKPSKCQWDRKTLEYLGHEVGDGQYSIPNTRVILLQEYARPTTKKQLRSFLSMIGYYTSFIANFANHSAKLTSATSSKAPIKVVWTDQMNKAFESLKEAVCKTATLTIPESDDIFILQTDASGGIGVLSVIRDGIKHPTAFFSRQLKQYQKNYSATELEALALVDSVLQFEMYLYGRDYKVEVDHKALLALPSGNKLNKRLRGLWLKVISFSFKIRYRKGSANGNADGFSRQPWPMYFANVCVCCAVVHR